MSAQGKDIRISISDATDGENPSGSEVDLRTNPKKKKKGFIKSLSFRRKSKKIKEPNPRYSDPNVQENYYKRESGSIDCESELQMKLLSSATSERDSIVGETTLNRLSSNILSLVSNQKQKNVISEEIIPIKLDLPTEVSFKMLLDLVEQSNEEKFVLYLPIYEKTSGSAELCTILHETVRRNLISCTRALLDYQFDIFDINNELRTPFAVACYKGFPEILEMLLKKLKPINRTDLREPLLAIVVNEMAYHDTYDAHYKCFEMLIDCSYVDVNVQDQITTNTALHNAIAYGNEEIILKLLKKCPILSTRNKTGYLAMQYIEADVFEKFLNTRISTSEQRACHEDHEIRIDYSFLKPVDESNGEMTPIEYMAESPDLQKLLQHPVIWSFILIKWYQIRFAFYLNFILFTIYSMSIITYFVLYYGDTNMSKMHIALRIMSFMGWCYVLIRECVQMYISRWKYFRSIINYLELVMLALTLSILCIDQLKNERRVISAIIILFSGAEFTLLLGALPLSSVTTHMAMLKRVSVNFIKSFSFYSIHIFIFAMCFFAIFRENNLEVQTRSAETLEGDQQYLQFKTFALTLMRTLAMFNGELNAAEFDFNKTFVAYIVFVLFVLFISIVLMNLLNGLAVNDTQEIRAESECQNLIHRALLLKKYEQFFFVNWREKNLFFQRMSPLFSTKILGIKVNDKRLPIKLSPWETNKNCDHLEMEIIDMNFKPFKMKRKLIKRAKEILEEVREEKVTQKQIYDRKCIDEILEYFNNNFLKKNQQSL